MNLLDTPRRRRVLFTLLYLSEGAPIGFIWWALPSLQREAGVPIESIGALAGMLVIPWSLKFLWAPLIDVARGARFGHRGWIVTSQALMVLTLLPLLRLDLRDGYAAMVPFLFLHAMAAATQDASIDALAIATTRPVERGALNGWMQAGMLAGRAGLGGGALILAQWWGFRPVVMLLVGVIAALILLAPFYRPASAGSPARTGKVRRFGATLRRAASSRTTWIAIAFAATAGAGFEAAGILAGPFLIDFGFSRSEVGTFYALPSVVAMMAGAIAGGAAADRWGRRRAVAAFLVLLSVAILALAAVPGLGGGAWAWGGLSFLYLGIGLFTAASYALFMDLTDPSLGATQFSAFMGATNLCEAWASHLGGRMAGAWGYSPALAVMALISLPALLFLKGLRAPSPPEGGSRVGP